MENKIRDTITAFIDRGEAITESYQYDAFGNVTIIHPLGFPIPQSAIGNRYMFQGREYDEATKLYNFRARWYDPETGRWISKDPIGIAGGLNQYVAFDNNPINIVDPFGFMGSKSAGQAAGAGAELYDNGNPFDYRSSMSPQERANDNAYNQHQNAEDAYPKGTEVEIDPTKSRDTTPPRTSPHGDIRKGRKNEMPWDERYRYTTKDDDPKKHE